MRRIISPQLLLPLDPETTGTQLIPLVVGIAIPWGWLVYHQRPARSMDGKIKDHVIGHVGFPDLVLVRAPTVAFIECKSRYEKLREPRMGVRGSQTEWAEAFEDCPGIWYMIWRAKDWPSIVTFLAEERWPGLAA